MRRTAFDIAARKASSVWGGRTARRTAFEMCTKIYAIFYKLIFFMVYAWVCSSISQKREQCRRAESADFGHVAALGWILFLGRGG
jgi:hypothetical protein